MMRLPNVQRAEGLDACFVGAPFDLGHACLPVMNWRKPLRCAVETKRVPLGITRAESREC